MQTKRDGKTNLRIRRQRHMCDKGNDRNAVQVRYHLSREKPSRMGIASKIISVKNLYKQVCVLLLELVGSERDRDRHMFNVPFSVGSVAMV